MMRLGLVDLNGKPLIPRTSGDAGFRNPSQDAGSDQSGVHIIVTKVPDKVQPFGGGVRGEPLL